MIPVPICDAEVNTMIPEHNLKTVKSLTFFVGENAKTARKWLKWMSYDTIQNANIQELNQHTINHNSLIEPLLQGHNIGLLSDAGCPGIADPGAAILKLAHEKNIEVIPLVGPSSIVLSIMASGFNGQNFAFIGYLPIEQQPKIKRIKELELLCKKHNQAQYFIETPYRNNQLLEVLLKNLQPATYLFLGVNIGDLKQRLICKSINEFKKLKLPDLNKIPVVFGIY